MLRLILILVNEQRASKWNIWCVQLMKHASVIVVTNLTWLTIFGVLVCAEMTTFIGHYSCLPCQFDCSPACWDVETSDSKFWATFDVINRYSTDTSAKHISWRHKESNSLRYRVLASGYLYCQCLRRLEQLFRSKASDFWREKKVQGERLPAWEIGVFERKQEADRASATILWWPSW